LHNESTGTYPAKQDDLRRKRNRKASYEDVYRFHEFVYFHHRGDRLRASRVPAVSADRSPLLAPARATTIRSPYDVNEALLAYAASPSARLAETRRFAPADRERYRQEPRAHAIEVGFARLGGTRISASLVRYGMEMVVVGAPSPTYTLGIRRRGMLRVDWGGQDGIWPATSAVLYRERDGMRVTTSENHAGIALELPYARIAALLESLIERPVGADLQLSPALDLSTEAGASVARLIAYIEAELAQPGSLLANSAVGASLEATLIRALLVTQQHQFSSLLERPAPAAAPYNVRRAEAYMQAHADENISLDRLAEVAGCSVRSLQMAFRQSRGTTPGKMLRQIRLERAHQYLLAAGGSETVGSIALRHGFTNQGRFAREYRARFGIRPLETLRQPRSP